MSMFILRRHQNFQEKIVIEIIEDDIKNQKSVSLKGLYIFSTKIEHARIKHEPLITIYTITKH